MTVPKQRAGDDFSEPLSEAVWGVVQRAQGGDQAAIAELYERYSNMVFRYVYSKVRNRDLAEDLAQDVWVRALRSLHRYTHTGRDFGAWLITIARNHTVDYFKSSRTRCEVTTSDVTVFIGEAADTHREGHPESALDVLVSEAIRVGISQLSPDQRELIRLRFLGELSQNETADAMGRNVGAVKALQWRATNSLAAVLGDGVDERGPLKRLRMVTS